MAADEAPAGLDHAQGHARIRADGGLVAVCDECGAPEDTEHRATCDSHEAIHARRECYRLRWCDGCEAEADAAYQASLD